MNIDDPLEAFLHKGGGKDDKQDPGRERRQKKLPASDQRDEHHAGRKGQVCSFCHSSIEGDQDRHEPSQGQCADSAGRRRMHSKRQEHQRGKHHQFRRGHVKLKDPEPERP